MTWLNGQTAKQRTKLITCSTSFVQYRVVSSAAVEFICADTYATLNLKALRVRFTSPYPLENSEGSCLHLLDMFTSCTVGSNGQETHSTLFIVVRQLSQRDRGGWSMEIVGSSFVHTVIWRDTIMYVHRGLHPNCSWKWTRLLRDEVSLPKVHGARFTPAKLSCDHSLHAVSRAM